MIQADRRMVAEFDAAIQPFMNKLNRMGDGVQKFKRESQVGFQETERRANRTGQAMAALRSSAIALGGAATIAALGRFGDAAVSVENQLRGIGAGADETRKKIYALAIETRTPVEATVGLLRSMQKSLRDQPLEQTIRQVGTLNRLLTVGGLDGAARGSVSLQFGQALQSGVLQGDELRSLREAAPYELLEAIANAAGGTVAELRDLGAAGALTRDVMVQALTDLEQTARDKFGAFKMTTAEAGENLRTGMMAVIGAMNEGAEATATVAGIQQGLARFMLENAEAGRVLGQSLRMVAEAGLLLAGSRGLLLAGNVVQDVTTKLVKLRRGASLTARAMSALRGALAIFGGPIGLAIFAAGTAFLTLSRHAKSAAEHIEAAGQHLDKSREAASAYRQAAKEIETDGRRLEQVERDIEQAIADQATAAEATARREKEAIQSRIEKNQELLELQQRIAGEEVKRAQDSVRKSRAKLGRTGSDFLIEDAFRQRSGPALDQRLIEIAEMSAEQAIEAAQRLIEAKETMLDAEFQFLKDVADLELQALKVGDQAARSIGDAVETVEDAADAADEAVRKLREQVRTTLDNEREFDALEDQVKTVRDLLSSYAFDDDQEVRRAVDLVVEALEDAEGKIGDLNESELDGLKEQVAGLLGLFDDFLAKIGLVREEMEAPGLTYGPPTRNTRASRNRSAREAARSGIRDLIGYAEGTDKGRGYNETLDYGRWTGGPVNLVNMTVNEVLRLQSQMLSNPENRALYGDGKGSSAVGRYQIVSKTLKSLKSQMGLSGNEKFSARLQDAMADRLIAGRMGQGVEGMRAEWQGLKNVGANHIRTALGAQTIITDPSTQEWGGTSAEVDARRTLTDQLEQSNARRKLEVEMIGKTASKQAYLLTKFELLNDAKRRGVDLDQVMIDSSRTYREEIEAQAEAAAARVEAEERLADAQEHAAQRAQFMENVQRSLKEGIIDSILHARSFADALANVADMLARAALEAALFGSGPFGGGSGGGLFGGIINAIFPTTTSATGNVMTQFGPTQLTSAGGGGIASGPRLSIFGEGDDPEAYVPLPDGRTIPVTLSMPEVPSSIGGAPAGGDTFIFAPNVDAKGADQAAVSRLESGLAAMHQGFEDRVHKTLRNARNRNSNDWDN
jgi:tape measure domain-containing protein